MRWRPQAPNWRISAFEKRLRETEASWNVVVSVKRSGRGECFLKLEHLSNHTYSENSKKFVTRCCDRMCDLTVLLASICYRKTAARPFDTICDILRALRLVQSLLKGRNAPIWHIGNRGVNAHLKTIDLRNKTVIFENRNSRISDIITS